MCISADCAARSTARTSSTSSARSGAAATLSTWTRHSLGAIALLAFLTGAAFAQAPLVFPPPPIPDDNPQSPPKVELGRRLFYDVRLSGSGEYSCASCHQQSRAFSDGRRVGVGVSGEEHRRNVPSLTNVGYWPVLTWFDPQLRRLEDQLLVPLFGHKPVEMGASEDRMLSMLASDEVYRDLFGRAFGGEVSLAKVARAIAAFERTLISFNSPWDRYRAGDENAISASAKRGEALFFDEQTNCFRCHPAPYFTDTYKAADLPFEEIAFHDIGRGDAALTRVRAPSLRNIAVTGPYLSDGSGTSLDEVIGIYTAGGTGPGQTRATKSAYIRPFTLSYTERSDLIEFLESLTDRDFLTDPRFSDPFAR